MVSDPSVDGAFPGPRKSNRALRTISEVSRELSLPQHVLRFWESRFPQIRPVKKEGGRRYYRPEDVELIRRIRELLYESGFTVKGAQKLLAEEKGMKPPLAMGKQDAIHLADPLRAVLKEIRDDLDYLRQRLETELSS